jgi:hypothetical protein
MVRNDSDNHYFTAQNSKNNFCNTSDIKLECLLLVDMTSHITQKY